jgi:ferredoxin-NADP reductase
LKTVAPNSNFYHSFTIKNNKITQAVKIRSIEHLTHDVLKVIAQRPGLLKYIPGQAADVSINKPGWQNEFRPFTFTSLPEDDHLEFTIKTYPSHNGVTDQMRSLIPGDELLIGEVFGDLAYKGEGIFIAGGAGITPFIAMLKELEKKNQLGNNKLLFANKTKADIILENKFKTLLGKNFVNILSDELVAGYDQGFITAAIIKKYIDPSVKYFYLCGPPPMMQSIETILDSLGVSKEQLIKEAF